MDWKSGIAGFRAYLQLEKGMSQHTIDGYLSDVTKFSLFMREQHETTSPATITKEHIQAFLGYLYDLGLSARTQARMISGLKAFFQFAIVEHIVDSNPVNLVESPRLSRKIPEALSIDEMEAFLAAIDLSHPQGQRNRAIFEILYACGLRVSELVNLKISNLYFDIDIIKVLGKNNKERLVPIGEGAQYFTKTYLSTERIPHAKPKKGAEDIVFLNRRGGQLTRNMIFMLCKEYAEKAGIAKNVSPHTFRHTFATHLVEGGADLRAVQDMLGHVSITTTEIYTHLDANFLRETIDLYHPRSKRMVQQKTDIGTYE